MTVVRKFRLAFVVIGLAVLVPVVLLVGRAVQSVAREREARHKTVAERVFDEMERALSGILEREEARPVEQYDRSITPVDAPFVLGYLEIDPAGEVRMLEGSRATAPELTQLLRASLGAAPASARTEAAPPSTPEGAQLPGTTVELGRRESTDQRAQAEESELGSAYDALRSLNKAVAQRAERQHKARENELALAMADRAAAAPVERSRTFEARENDARRDEAPEPARMGATHAGEESRAAPAPADTHAKVSAPRAQEREAVAAGPASERSPMEGRVVDGRYLLLSRVVSRDGRPHRQGLVIDVEELGDWLAARAIGGDGLAQLATLTFGTRLSPGASAVATDLTYEHRFAEPFADLNARLVLAPLSSASGTGYVYALSTLLLVTLVLGLASLYRMVSVAVSFAERRSHFVATVSHELKTPLTAIRMYGEMLRDGMVSSDEKRAEYYRHITVESERLSRLINNVLEFSRLEKGTRQMALVTGPLAPVVQEATTLLAPHVQGEGFALDVDVASDLPPVRYERDAVLQVIFNLVDNAVKYARGAPSNRITLACRRDERGVRLTIRDNGRGVPARHLRRIFEPFFRGETELTRRSKGSGLGLALVRGLALRMGARVDGRNIPDGGFEVAIVFPPASAA